MKTVKLDGGPGDSRDVDDWGFVCTWLPRGVPVDKYAEHYYSRANIGEPFKFDPLLTNYTARVRKETWPDG